MAYYATINDDTAFADAVALAIGSRKGDSYEAMDGAVPVKREGHAPSDFERILAALGFDPDTTNHDDFERWLLEKVYLKNKPTPEFLKFVIWGISPALDPSSAAKELPTKTAEDELLWMSAVILNAVYDPARRDAVLIAITNACLSLGIKYEAQEADVKKPTIKPF